MSESPSNHHRRDMRRAVRDDLSRHARRESGPRSFWHSLGVLGMVGWPIALLSAGGALLGRVLDSRFETGIRFTLILLTVGALLGSITAYRVLKGPLRWMD